MINIWITLAFILQAHALSLESFALARLAAVRSAEELELQRKEFAELSVANKACHIQLEAKQVPLACYEAVELSKRLPEKLEGLPSLPKLDRFCFRAAFALAVDDGDTRYATAACRAKVERARKIRAYRDSDDDFWPAN